VILASEDVGMADPHALGIATAAAQAVEFVGLPEAGLNLAQAVVHLALAPKSNRAALAWWAAQGDVRRRPLGPVPPELRDAHYRGAGSSGTAWATSILTMTHEGSSKPFTCQKDSSGVATTSLRNTVPRRGSPSAGGHGGANRVQSSDN